MDTISISDAELSELDNKMWGLLQDFYNGDGNTMKPHVFGIGKDEDGKFRVAGVAVVPTDLPRELTQALVKAITQAVLEDEDTVLACFVSEAYMYKLDREKVNPEDEQAVEEYLKTHEDAKTEACILLYSWDGASRAMVAHQINKGGTLERGVLNKDGEFGGQMVMGAECAPEGVTVH